MSAFIVPNAHITALAVYAERHSIHSAMDCGQVNAEKVGTVLLDENINSVNYRYKEENTDACFVIDSWAEHRSFTPLQIIKAARCLNYQSCEHPEWSKSRAYAILQEIVMTAISQLPSYEDADWVIDAPSKPPVSA